MTEAETEDLDLNEARRNLERNMLAAKAASLLVIAADEEDAAGSVGENARSRRHDEVRGICIAAETLGLVLTADVLMEIADRLLVDALNAARS